MTVAALAGGTIYELASRPVETLEGALVAVAACLALAWIAVSYAHVRARVKSK